MSIFETYFSDNKKHIAILIDPDKHSINSATKIAQKIEKSVADIIFVGGSLVSNSVTDIVSALKSETSKPVILFPGSPSQISSNVDAMLLLSLVSGRNPQYLIGSAVEASMQIYKLGIETISTAYILIDGGKCTAVQYISNTQPIPSDKPDLVLATALASKFIGMKAIYLEAGSGALNPVSSQIISIVKQHANLPLIVGGGLRTKNSIENAFNSGADIVVIGTAIENNENFFNQLSVK
ncbi:MAG: geranylgeranylglyceryl/heptaprenylglyceryl phosphate synthase [Bacteroidales bacterium]|nr:geranylgeranylglyceryl/heptaprenylglyceryl phosphate synthase [Bacteroidales bacterium]